MRSHLTSTATPNGLHTSEISPSSLRNQSTVMGSRLPVTINHFPRLIQIQTSTISLNTKSIMASTASFPFLPPEKMIRTLMTRSRQPSDHLLPRLRETKWYLNHLRRSGKNTKIVNTTHHLSSQDSIQRLIPNKISLPGNYRTSWEILKRPSSIKLRISNQSCKA